MSTFHTILSIAFSFLFVPYPASSTIVCPYSSCDETGPVIRFPFRIKGFQPARCGYPGYGLTCNNISQTILTLPASGDFVVHDIDYINEWIYVNDPKSCLPKQILHFSLAGSEFGPTVSRNYTLFNCSASKWSDFIIAGSVPVFCMGSANSTVIALDSGDSTSLSGVPTPVCREVARVVSPVELSAVNSLPDMKLTPRSKGFRLQKRVSGFTVKVKG